VIHSGFHETLKTGMLIAIPYGSIRVGLWKKADALWHLWRQGRRQGIPFRFLMTPGSVRDIAPVHALGGIFIRWVCVIDVEQLIDSLANNASNAGAQFFYDRRLSVSTRIVPAISSARQREISKPAS
jgi:hypothetical protein